MVDGHLDAELLLDVRLHLGRDGVPHRPPPCPESNGAGRHPEPDAADIKEKFNIERSTDHISTSKGIILHPKKKGGKGAKKPAAQGAEATEGEAKEGVGRKVVVQHKPAPARSGKEAGIPLEDILYVKRLVGRFGPDHLHTLIDAFAR